MRNPAAVERNCAPIWNFFRYERDGEERESEFLWGFYRHRRGMRGQNRSIFPIYQSESTPGDVAGDVPKSRKWSVLYGLFGYSHTGLQREIKLIYLFRIKWGGEPPRQLNENISSDSDE